MRSVSGLLVNMRRERSLRRRLSLPIVGAVLSSIFFIFFNVFFYFCAWPQVDVQLLSGLRTVPCFAGDTRCGTQAGTGRCWMSDARKLWVLDQDLTSHIHLLDGRTQHRPSGGPCMGYYIRRSGDMVIWT